MRSYESIRRLWITPFALLTLFTLGCGGDDDAAELVSSVSSSAFSALVPALGIQSPTQADSTDSSAARVRAKSKLSGKSGSQQAGSNDVSTALTATEMKAELAEILARTDVTTCFDGVDVRSFNKEVSCYGPQLAFTYHPDCSVLSGGICQDQMQTTQSIGGVTYNIHPGGDSGIMGEVEVDESCTSAKINSLVGGAAYTVHQAMRFMAAVACVANNTGSALPSTAGESLNMTEILTEKFPAITFKSVVVTQEADLVDALPVYKLEFDATVSNDALKFVLRNLKTETGQKGRFYGYNDNGDSRQAVSVIYDVSDTATNVLINTATQPNTVAWDALFETDGDFIFSNWVGAMGQGYGNGRYLLINMNSDGSGKLKFAWQAGSNDAHTRVFHAVTTASGSAISGAGYFGYGPKLTNASVGTIGGMCCAWATPNGQCMTGENVYDLDGYSQAQQISLNTTTKKFDVVDSKLFYAPTLSCNDASLPFIWGTVSSGAVSEVTATNYSSTSTTGSGTATNELLDYLNTAGTGGWTALGTISVPTF